MSVYNSSMPDVPTTQIIFTYYSVPTRYAEVKKFFITKTYLLWICLYFLENKTKIKMLLFFFLPEATTPLQFSSKSQMHRFFL